MIHIQYSILFNHSIIIETIKNRSIIYQYFTGKQAGKISSLVDHIEIVDGKISYEWGSAGSAGLAFIGTRAEYEVAKMIPEGSEGHIPAKAMVIITDEDDTVKGDIK